MEETQEERNRYSCPERRKAGQEQFVMLSQLVTKKAKHELTCPVAQPFI